VAWGIIKNPNFYKLLKAGDRNDSLNGILLHRLDIDWKYTVNKLEDAIKPAELLDKYGIFHPRSTCVKIDPQKAQHLIKNM